MQKLCDHFIIINESDSWWAAMLSENKEKIVCCPKKSDWFGYEENRESLIPRRWVEIEQDLTPQYMWEIDEGDKTHILNYDLDDSSIVLELGGYIGEWSDKLLSKVNPKLIIVEPVGEFFNELWVKYKDLPNVFLLNSAIGIDNRETNIHINGSASSINNISDNITTVRTITIEDIINYHNIDKYIDLVQINIECYEYNLLKKWISNGMIKKIKNIQIQFHTFCENYISDYNEIYNGLIESGFEIKYKYDFVWEGWVNKKL